MKGTKTVRDMLLSLAVVGAMVAVIYVFIPHDDTPQPLKRVDFTIEQATAQRAVDYPVLAPKGLSQDWKATSVRFNATDGDHWHLGFHAPDGKYVAVEQSTEKAPVFIDRVTQRARETGAVERIGGKEWQSYRGERYDALVLTEKGATTVVTGSGSSAQLKQLAEALKAS